MTYIWCWLIGKFIKFFTEIKKKFDWKAKEETNDQFIARLKKEYYQWFRNWNINDTSAIINILIT